MVARFSHTGTHNIPLHKDGTSIHVQGNYNNKYVLTFVKLIDEHYYCQVLSGSYSFNSLQLLPT